MKKKSVVLSIACLLLLVASPVFSRSISAQTSPGSCPSNEILNWTLVGGTPNTLASILTTASTPAFELSEFMYWGIYPMLGPTGVQYWNASLVDWIKSNSNYTQWSVNVKPGLKWSNGQDVTSADIVATYSPSFGFNPSYDFTGEYKKVVSVVAVNNSEVQFNLNQSDAHFLETISTLVLTNVLPKTDANPNYTGFGIDPVVVGPFYPSNYQPGQTQMVMYRNPYFYTTGLPEPKICQIDVTFVESTADAETAVKSGATDLAEVDPSSVGTVLQNPNVHILSQNDSLITSITWNVTAYPFNMTNFRQAFAYGINQSQIIQQAFAGFGDAAFASEGTVPPTINGLYDPNQMKYNFDPNKALSLLQSAGIKKGSDGFLQYPNGTDVSLTLWGDDSSTFDTVATGIVQTDLQSLGFKVTQHLTTFANLGSFTSVAPATLYLASNHGAIFPDAAIDAQPGWNVYSEPGLPEPYWEYPPSIDNQYQSNLTAINNTDNQSQVEQYLHNIEELNAQYLPTLVVTYGDALFAYNTQHWTNWLTFPQGWVHINDNEAPQEFAYLQPVGSSVSTTSNSATASSVSSSVSASSAVSSSASKTTTAASSSALSTSSSSNSAVSLNSWAVASAGIVMAIIASTVLIARRRGKRY